MTELSLAEGLTLPIDTVTQAVAILAKRRAGKSYLARRFYEELHAAGQQIIVVDPKGDHWGCRSAADGKSPGIPIIILGGDHGDLPIEASAGAVVAKLAVEERVSVLLDLSLLRKHEVATFMTAFLEELYRLKARAEYRTPVMLIIDEADAVAPQKPQPNEMRMLGAANDIVRRGGQRGIGCTLITQRSAVLSKDVLTQVQMLVTLRTMSPQDLAAVKAWIDVHGTLEQQKELMASLPSLPIGTAWFWSPGWPTDAGIFVRSKVLPIRTFDSGATPKAGETTVAPKLLAEVDLGAVQRSMADAIEQAKENDPRALKEEVKRLRAQLAVAPGAASFDKSKAEALVRSLSERKKSLEILNHVIHGTQRELHSLVGNLQQHVEALVDLARSDHGAMNLEEFLDQLDAAPPQQPPLVTEQRRSRPEEERLPSRATRARIAEGAAKPDGATSLPSGMMGTLVVAYQFGDRGVRGVTVQAFTGLSIRTVQNYFVELSGQGLIRREGGRVFITAKGAKRVPSETKPFPRGPAFIKLMIASLPDGESKLLQQIFAAHPKPVSTAKLAESHRNLSPRTIQNYLVHLSSRALVQRSGGRSMIHSGALE